MGAFEFPFGANLSTNGFDFSYQKFHCPPPRLFSFSFNKKPTNSPLFFSYFNIVMFFSSLYTYSSRRRFGVLM